MDKEYTVKVRAERGLSTEDIASSTGLSVEEVNKILGVNNDTSGTSVPSTPATAGE